MRRSASDSPGESKHVQKEGRRQAGRQADAATDGVTSARFEKMAPQRLQKMSPKSQILVLFEFLKR